MGYLKRVVEVGTGKAAAVPGYCVAGKTGTAQKPTEVGFRSGKHIGSFVGIMPADDPQFVILTIIDEPKGSIYGGVVAAPVVREVGRFALQYLNIPPAQTPPDDQE
jgi:cell division protein FtsI/penicillin-binding protein 2